MHYSIHIKDNVEAFQDYLSTFQSLFLMGFLLLLISRKSSFRYLVQLSGRDPFQFSDPERFLPERWLRGCPVQHNAHPYASIIFSHGPRMCIGRRYAELENYILAIKILQRYRLEYHHGDVGINTEFVNKPDKDIKLKFILRK